MKELKKGSKAPFRGYLLNVSEYEQYRLLFNVIERYKPLLERYCDEV